MQISVRGDRRFPDAEHFRSRAAFILQLFPVCAPAAQHGFDNADPVKSGFNAPPVEVPDHRFLFLKVSPEKNQQRFVVPFFIPRIPEKRKQVTEVFLPVILVPVFLLHQDLPLAFPCPVPVVVCPAEEIGKRNLRPGQQVLRRLLQQFLSPEVVMVIDKAVDMVLFRDPRLPVQRFRFQQVIVIPVQRNPRLPVPGEQRLCFPDVRPFRESFSPPFVILRNAVELGKVICEYLHGAILVFSGF